MKITVINKRPVTGLGVYCVDGTTVIPGAQKEMTGRSKADVIFQLASQDDDVTVNAEIEGSDRAPIICDMKNPADPGSGVGTAAACGFDLETEAAAAANVAPQMYMGAFDDAACQIPSTTGTLDTAATGTIDSGAGTNLLKVTPDAAGEVSVTLTNSADTTIYMKAWPVGTDYVIDSKETDEVTFTP